MPMRGRSFLKLLDFTPEELGELLQLAAELKAAEEGGGAPPPVRGEADCADF